MTAQTNPTRRAVIYLLWNKRGEVPDYVPYALERLRPFASHILLVVNGALADGQASRLEAVADDVLERENVGLDVGGYADALTHLGAARLAEFDEVILMNYTWFGPVRDFAPMFERMEALDVDFWGITDHAEVQPNPITGRGVMHEHLQSHWIAIRRRMFTSDAWRSYWATMPTIASYNDSVAHHEARFTEYFATRGFSWVSAFPNAKYELDHPIMMAPEALIEDGCPILKRRLFFHDPLELDGYAVVGRWVLKTATAEGYPEELIWRDLVRSDPPRVLNANANMLEVLPDVDVSYDPERPLRTVAIVHIYYPDMTDELLQWLSALPTSYDLVVTTADDDRAAEIRERITRRADPQIGTWEVRIVESNRGRDISAFYVTCGDVLRSGEYDVFVKIHSKRPAQDGITRGGLFRRQQLTNLLNSPGYAANLMALFQKEPGLGLAFAPMIHTGYPTLGSGWFGNRERAGDVAEILGVRVPLDGNSPIAPYGSMFVGRPEALRLIAEGPWGFDDFQDETEYKDGSLAHTIERMPAYAAAELGYHTRNVATTEWASISHTRLEHKADSLADFATAQAGLHGLPHGSFRARTRQKLRFAKFYLMRFHPHTARVLRAALEPVYRLRRRTK